MNANQIPKLPNFLWRQSFDFFIGGSSSGDFGNQSTHPKPKLLLNIGERDASVFHKVMKGRRAENVLINNARNDAPARGLYNEFLRTDLDKHRKVFELVGAKTKVAPSDDQLSGLGFSSTKPAVVTVRLEHKRGRPLFNIHF